MSPYILWIICVFFGQLSDALLCYRNGLPFCCSGYKKNETSGQCDKCVPGYAGPNCAYSCDYPTYGEDCLRECSCSVDLCDFSSGCKVTNKPALSTKIFTSQTMKTNSVGYRNAENATTDLDSSHTTTTRSNVMDFVINCWNSQSKNCLIVFIIHHHNIVQVEGLKMKITHK
uniref:Uncharacterized protein n=2 Tax=Magallana gigas TaxID=29159 RepID=A0A8W8J5K8_MAGGI